MRVISGNCRGIRLVAPPGFTTRPTADRVKEALFSILSSRINFTDIRVLDICAGSGSLGIEALSRGAGSCCFIECASSAIQILNKNLTVTRLHSQSVILRLDAEKAVRNIAGRGHCFDLVFFDPPYDSALYQSVLEMLDSTGVLHPGSILVAECAVRKPLPELYGRLKRFERRVYGETALEFYAMEEQ